MLVELKQAGPNDECIPTSFRMPHSLELDRFPP